MSEILFHYQKINPTTWVYLSSLLMIGLFFQFNRFWSVRNLDLVLLILLSPGLLMVNQSRVGAEATPVPSDTLAAAPSMAEGAPADERVAPGIATATPTGAPVAAVAEAKAISRHQVAYMGYLWLFAVSLVWLVRMLADPTMVRRPLLEPNATKGCLVFLGCSLFVFLMANVITSNPTTDDLKPVEAANALLKAQDNSRDRDKPEEYARFGPGYYFLHALPSIPTHPFIRGDHPQSTRGQELIAKSMAIASHLAVVVALVIIGYWHFENIKMGIGAALLYLMLPYTAQMTGHVDHVLPAALLLWAVVLYRRPALAGILIGLATSVVYYPLFLLPLWISFYWQRGLARFVMGVVGSATVMICSLVFVSSDMLSFWLKVQQMFALWIPKTNVQELHGIWALGWDPWFRLPVIALCGVLAVGLAIWPSHKNLGTLLSCSAAVMVAVQFWHAFGDGGGMYMAWYLPLLLMTVFRPNLEDRVALTVLGESWFTRRRTRLAQFGRAA
ncbi:MAG TPA: glycosyltransferase family 87 protein [Pirellulaceae bacterium]|nr:glycosyltransferase family 87 protein [Pirellulaceae bacterium]